MGVYAPFGVTNYKNNNKRIARWISDSDKRQEGGMTIYMAVTADKYELPLGVFAGTREMAKTYGVSRQTIQTYIRRGSARRGIEKFIKVEATWR